MLWKIECFISYCRAVRSTLNKYKLQFVFESIWCVLNLKKQYICLWKNILKPMPYCRFLSPTHIPRVRNSEQYQETRWRGTWQSSILNLFSFQYLKMLLKYKKLINKLMINSNNCTIFIRCKTFLFLSLIVSCNR